MKKLVSVLLALVMCLSVTTLAWAEDTVVYPEGVTKESFKNATTVYYTNNLGEVKSGGSTESETTALVAYVDSNNEVQYAADVWAAIKNGASTIYCKEGAMLLMRQRPQDTNRSPDLTSDLTIYANGANFQYGELSMNMTEAGRAAGITLKVYDAKNIKVWGGTPNDGVTQTIVMENCRNIGESATGDKGIMLYITGTTGTVNATIKGCHIEKNSSGIYMSTNGDLTVIDTTFVDCATAIKVSYKGTGERTNTIYNCTFDGCGCTTEDAGNTTWLADDSSAIKMKNGSTGKLTATIEKNTITNTKGERGDIQVISENGIADVTVKSTAAKVAVTEKNASAPAISEITANDILTVNGNGGAEVQQPDPDPEPPTPVEPEQPAHTNRRYPATTTTTAETPATGTDVTSAKTFDGGVALYVGMALTSTLGMAWVGKKRAQ